MDSLRCGLGWTLQGSTEKKISSGFTSFGFIPSPITGEALALNTALLVAQEAHATSIACYMDFQILVSLLNSGGSTNELQNVLFDVRSISRSFTSILYLFVPRSLNFVAEGLAKVGFVTNRISSFNGV